MKFLGLKKQQEGRFITRYDLRYETVDGREKIYEMISRNHQIDSFEQLSETTAEAVVLILHNQAGDQILLNREFRMATGQWVYNFPAGLIDPGEDLLESAARELREETGLSLAAVDDILYDSYSAIGFSNEKNRCVIGRAEGTICPSDSAFEEIEARWFRRDEIRELLKTEFFAARTQAYCYLWSREC